VLKRNEDKFKLADDTISDSVLQEAIDLSLDLEEGEQQGSLDHEDHDLLNKKKKRTTKKIVPEFTVITRSKKLKLKKKQK
jgi:hypothetical protein